MNDDISSKINDIKGIVSIPDNSIFIFSALVIAVIIVLIIIAVLIYHFFKNRKKNIRKEYYEILENIDFSDSKKASYEITKYSRLISHNEREEKLSRELIEELAKYKYKKSVEEISEEIKGKFSTFMDVVDV